MMKILIVDDDPVVLSSCKRILESEGYTVSLTSSVKEALRMLDKHHRGAPPDPQTQHPLGDRTVVLHRSLKVE